MAYGIDMARLRHELLQPSAAMRLLLSRLDLKRLPDRDARLIEAVTKAAGQVEENLQALCDYLALKEGTTVPDSRPVMPQTLSAALSEQCNQSFREAGLALSVRCATDTPLNGDPQLIEQAALNLIDNALAFSAEGAVEVAILREGSEAVIQVTDQGCGLPDGDPTRLFDAFVVAQAENARRTERFGLGLTIAAMIAAAHGGSLSLAAGPDGGVCAAFRLPA